MNIASVLRNNDGIAKSAGVNGRLWQIIDLAIQVAFLWYFITGRFVRLL